MSRRDQGYVKAPGLSTGLTESRSKGRELNGKGGCIHDFATYLSYDSGHMVGMMLRMTSRVLPALALLGLLAACEGHRVISRGFDVAYSSPEAGGGAGDRLWVEVLGTPRKDWNADALRAAVIDIFRKDGAAWLNTTYTGDAAEAHNPSYRLRVLFNPASGSPSASACGKAVSESEGEGASGDVFMALCRDETALSYGWGILDKIGPLEGERQKLGSFLLIMAMTILPDRNPQRDGICNPPNSC